MSGGDDSIQLAIVIKDVSEIKTMVQDMHRTIHIDNGKPAITTRIDRLEQDSKRRTWWNRTWAGAAVVAMVASIASWYHGGSP